MRHVYVSMCLVVSKHDKCMNVCISTVALFISTAKAICGKTFKSHWYVNKVLMWHPFYHCISQGACVLDEMTEVEVFEVLHQRLYDEPIEVHTDMDVHCGVLLSFVLCRL